MKIIRVSKDTNYTVINNTGIRDERLSWKAKGILCYLLSLPDEWTVVVEELQKHADDKTTSLRTGLKELETHGYLVRKQNREKGKFGSWETIVYEVPHEQKPNAEKPHAVKPNSENRTLLSTNKTNYLNKQNTNNNHQEIILYLNQSASKDFRANNKKTQTLIDQRVKEGFTVLDFKKVIDNKVSEWLHDSKMNAYLRPETLFGTKFESYLNQEIKKDVGGKSDGVNATSDKETSQGVYRYGSEQYTDLGF